MSISLSISPTTTATTTTNTNSTVRRRQSMSAPSDIDQAELVNAQQDEVDSLGKGTYVCEDESESELSNVRTPMMDPQLRSPQRDGLGFPSHNIYWQLYLGSQALMILSMLAIIVWVVKYLGGLNFAEPSAVFNFHPLLMVSAFVFCYSNGILLYRTFRYDTKQRLKLWHTITQGSAMLIGSLGSISVFYFHQKANIPHFYSLHSWLGIVTWLLFVSQFSTGFVTFLFPGLSYTLRQNLMPYHRFIGIATFVLATATCLTGLNEKAIFSMSNKYANLPPAGVLINMIGILLVVNAAVVVYLVTKIEYKRKPLPEEQVINLNFDLSSPN